MSRGRFFAGVGAVMFFALIDIFLKYWAITHVALASASPLPSPLAFALHKNPGIAFDIPIPLFLILPLTLLIVLVFGGFYGWRAYTELRFAEALACTMVCIGALGNFFDRLLNGFTTDFLIIFKTSAINISDILILVGMGLFLWYHKGSSPQEQT